MNYLRGGHEGIEPLVLWWAMVAAIGQQAQREAVKVLHRGVQRTRAPHCSDCIGRKHTHAEDDEPGYSAGYVRHLLRHWADTDTDAVRREWVQLRAMPERKRRQRNYCLCDPDSQNRPPAYRGSVPYGPVDLMPAERLDLERAYDALPMQWRGRTRVFLQMNGANDLAIDEMVRTGAFEHHHRARIAVEAGMVKYVKNPPAVLPEGGSVYEWLARFLSGGAVERAA